MDIKEFLEWKEMSDSLKILKDLEAAKRRELCSKVFSDAKAKAGSTVKLSLMGCNIVAKSTISKSIDEDVFNSIYKDLDEAGLNSVKFKPSLVAAFYNKLPENHLLHEAVTEKPGMPTLEVSKI